MLAKLNVFTFQRGFPPTTKWWLGHHDELICFDPSAGRVRAFICHDGSGRYARTIYGTLWTALRLMHSGAVTHIDMRSFPLCIVELALIERADILAVKSELEEVLVDVGMMTEEF
ncbi:hypothetical protein [Bradyrhizobium sp. Ec3.3]|uniref:hypothetical protein n=1 Tax=Bradyrhizobium sp. Ec3.3 TaxID=189753 RepID=UPI0004823E6C|nr:hypothetical protein [Bradyrhizobium sp. Ec3.3]